MSQHDSQELLSRLLDGLHEDLNLIQKKPYIEDTDCTDKDDSPAKAREFWVNFMRRNFSKIFQLFYGQFRAEIKCPECQYVSVKYDPFELVSLPVTKMLREFSFEAYFIAANHSKSADKVSFTIRPSNKKIPSAEEMVTEYCKVLNNGSRPDQYELCFSGFSVHGECIPTTMQAIDICKKCKDNTYKPRLFLFERTPEEVETAKNPDVVRLMVKLSYKEADPDAGTILSFTKLILANPTDTMGEVHYKVFLKLAHFISQKKLNGADEVDDEAYPAEVNDYRALYEEVVSSNMFRSGSIFSLNAKGDVFEHDSKTTVAEVIKKYEDKIDLMWNPKLRMLKIEAQIDNQAIKNGIVKTSSMKKLSSEETEVTVNALEVEGSKKLDIYKLFKDFCTPEILDVNNLYRCGNCKKEVQGLRKMDIYKVPKYLIIHMKKLKDSWGFSSYSSGSSELMVEFPVTNLDMTPFVLSGQPIETYNVDKSEFMDANNNRLAGRTFPKFTWGKDKLLYDCYGVINHYGSMHFGHYTAYGKNNNQWYLYDDSNVTKVDDPKSIVTEAAYVLFYERVDS